MGSFFSLRFVSLFAMNLSSHSKCKKQYCLEEVNNILHIMYIIGILFYHACLYIYIYIWVGWGGGVLSMKVI